MTDEKQDLDNLTKSPGWHRLTEHGMKEIEHRLMTATRNAANLEDDIKALNVLRQCIAARDAVEALLEWPERRLRALTALATAESQATTTQLSRRGNL